MDVPRTDTPGRIIAHRGASRVAPENTLAAIRTAAEMGVRWIEFDVSLLGTDLPVVHHDGSFGRTTSGRGLLADAKASDLAGIDAGAWFGKAFRGEPLPTLAAVLDLLDALGMSANLELKTHASEGPRLVEAVAPMLESRPWTRSRIIVSSFDHETLGLFRTAMPSQPLALLWVRPPPDWAEQVTAMAGAALHCDWRSLDGHVLREARTHGHEVRVYTINDPEPLRPFMHHGLTGVITDHPPLFLDQPDWLDWAGTAAEFSGAGP